METISLIPGDSDIDPVDIPATILVDSPMLASRATDDDIADGVIPLIELGWDELDWFSRTYQAYSPDQPLIYEPVSLPEQIGRLQTAHMFNIPGWEDQLAALTQQALLDNRSLYETNRQSFLNMVRDIGSRALHRLAHFIRWPLVVEIVAEIESPVLANSLDMNRLLLPGQLLINGVLSSTETIADYQEKADHLINDANQMIQITRDSWHNLTTGQIINLRRPDWRPERPNSRGNYVTFVSKGFEDYYIVVNWKHEMRMPVGSELSPSGRYSFDRKNPNIVALKGVLQWIDLDKNIQSVKWSPAERYALAHNLSVDYVLVDLVQWRAIAFTIDRSFDKLLITDDYLLLKSGKILSAISLANIVEGGHITAGDGIAELEDEYVSIVLGLDNQILVKSFRHATLLKITFDWTQAIDYLMTTTS